VGNRRGASMALCAIAANEKNALWVWTGLNWII